MTRMMVLACALLFYGLGLAHAQTRDETVVYVLLGVESGDKVNFPEKKISLIGPIKRIDKKTIEIVAKQEDAVDLFRITEDPECVFELVMPAESRGQDTQWHKTTAKFKIDFSRAYRVSRSDAWGGTERLGLDGKRVGCLENQCRDFAALGLLLNESGSRNERLEKAADYMRSKYCPGAPY